MTNNSSSPLRYSASSAVRLIDECVLALLQLTLHDGARAWEGFDFGVMDRLFEKGYILDPRGKSKSVVHTQKGLDRSKELFEELFWRK